MPATAQRAGAGAITSTIAATEAIAVPQIQLRRHPRCMRSLRRSFAKAPAAFGVQPWGGCRKFRRSSVQRSSVILRFSILLHVFFAECLLGAAEKGAHRRGIQFHGGCDLGIAEAIGAQQQKFGLSGIERGEHEANPVPFLMGRVQLLGSIDRARSGLAFTAAATGFDAKLIERHPDSGPVEPAAGALARAGLAGSPEFPEDLDGDFLGAGRMANDADYHARDSFVMGVEDGVEVQWLIDFGKLDSLAAGVHIRTTTREAIL